MSTPSLRRSARSAPTSQPSAVKPKTTSARAGGTAVVKREHDVSEVAAIHGGPHTLLGTSPASGRKRKRNAGGEVEVKQEGLDEDSKLTIKEEVDAALASSTPATPVGKTRGKGKPNKGSEGDDEIESMTPIASTSKSKPSRTTPSSAKKYGLTPGVTPFPDFPHPTPKECQDVSDLLSELHGRPQAPAVIPPPSTTMSGCGEVPSVLDALIRTLMSAATNLNNSSRAFRNVVDKYGTIQQGVGMGSVDWERVRVGTQQELFEAIQCGGLAANKSKNIKAILDMVYEENLERKAALIQAEEDGADLESAPIGADHETKDEKQVEVEKTDQGILSLDHMHALTTEEAMEKMTSYPGIGVKTASCTLLFCMSRPSFAVDTHVWRLCKWLGWTPATANRNDTYRHCDVRIPDELKYELHALFWKHGRYCAKCSLIPQKSLKETHDDISKRPCPLEALIKANGGRSDKKGKGGGGGGKRPTPKKRKLAVGKKGRRQRSSDVESDGSLTDDSSDAGDSMVFDDDKSLVQNGVTTKEYVD